MPGFYLYPCFIVVQWQYSVNLTVVHAFEFLCTRTDIQALHISRRCRLVTGVNADDSHLQSRGRRVCCHWHSAALNAVQTVWCWYTSVNSLTRKAFLYSGVCVCVCVLSAVYILVNIEQTPEKQKVSLASVGSVETAESANVKSFGKYRWRAGRRVGHFAAVSLRISHFLKAPLKKEKKTKTKLNALRLYFIKQTRAVVVFVERY